MRRLASKVPIAVLAASAQFGCIAHGISSFADHAEVVNVDLPLDPPSAVANCGGQPCSAVPVAYDQHTGRSNALFWTTWVAESAIAVWGIADLATRGNQSADITAVLAVPIFGLSAVVDLIGYPIRIDQFRPYGAANYRLRTAVGVDLDGSPSRLNIGDVLMLGGGILPRTVALGKLGAVGTPASSEARRPLLTRNQLVAVLELRNQLKGPDAEAVNAAYFGNQVRAAVKRDAPDAKVMTRENILVMLQASGRSLADCEGECEVDTGRRLGADLVISGELVRVGSKLKLDLRMHETHSGQLVSGAVAEGKSVDDLDLDLSRAVTALLLQDIKRP